MRSRASRLQVLALAAIFVAVVAACGEPKPSSPPQDLRVINNIEGPIQYLTWATPDYTIGDYQAQWRFGDVPNWSVPINIRTSESNGTTSTHSNSAARMTRGLGIEYCYRVRALTFGGLESDWSTEACARHWNYWWTQPAVAGTLSGQITDVLFTSSSGPAKLTWRLWNPSGPEGDRNTKSVNVWRRAAGDSEYVVVASLSPGAADTLPMSYVDEDFVEGFCYRLAVIAAGGRVSRLGDDLCPS